MGLDNFIQTAMNNVLKNPILSILRDINFSSILKQSNFINRDIGKSPYLVILHFLYMFVINRKISSFMKYSNDSYKKDVYYKLLKSSKYNWRELLLLTSVKLICKLHKLQNTIDAKVLIIDDNVEIKTISIYNTIGQLIKSTTNLDETIDVSDLKSGTYFISIELEKGIATEKFIKI